LVQMAVAFLSGPGVPFLPWDRLTFTSQELVIGQTKLSGLHPFFKQPCLTAFPFTRGASLLLETTSLSWWDEAYLSDRPRWDR
jgi:hypothetical protein